MKKILLTIGLVLSAGSVVAGSNVCVGAIVVADENGCQTISAGNNVVSSGNITVNGNTFSNNGVLVNPQKRGRTKTVTWNKHVFEKRASRLCRRGINMIKNSGTGQVYICD